jgi:hypothetical protein
MKSGRLPILLTLTLFIATFSLTAAYSQSVSAGPAPVAQVPPLIQFSGVATDEEGNPLNGTASITFSLYAAQQSGEPLWAETQTLQLDSAGHYSVQLGITQPSGVPNGLFSSGEARWLGVQIAGQPPQARVLLLSVPYAMKAGDAATIGGLPPSAFVLATPVNGATPSAAIVDDTANAETSSNPAPAAPSASSDVTTTGGTAGTIAAFSTSTNIQSSLLSQTAKTAINVAGQLNLPSISTATSTAGSDSRPLDFVASSYDSNTSAAVAQTFQWQAEPAGNDTSSAEGTLNLLFGEGTTKPAETGLLINRNGQITFASGQTFPGTGDGTITGVTTASGSGLTGGGTSGSLNLSLTNACAANQVLQWSGSGWVCITLAGGGTITGVTAGTGLSGGGTSGNVTLNLNTAQVPLLAATNTFTGNQTVDGNLSATGFVSGSGFQIGSNLFDYGSFTSENAFTGFAGNAATTGQGNTGTGVGALASISSGTVNTAIGYLSLTSETTGSENTALGYEALQNATTPSWNTAVGLSALAFDTTGGSNTAVGSAALVFNNTGSNNSGIGIYAGYAFPNLTGSNDTFLGAFTSPGSATSINNATAIGANAEVTASNSLVLGSINGVNGATASTNVGIGTTTPAYALDVHGTGNFTGTVNFASGQTFPGTGTITGVTAGSGLTGGGTSGSVNLGLNTACAATQILQWNGTSWACSNAGAGTITGVTAGADLTGGGTSGNITLNLNTASVPLLSANNTYTGSQTINNIEVISGSNGGGMLQVTNNLTSGPAPAVLGTTYSSGANAIRGVFAGTTGPGAGILGQTSTATAYGVVGQVLATSGTTAGVSGQSSSNGGFGVQGTSPYIGVSGESDGASGITGLPLIGAGVWGDTGGSSESLASAFIGVLGTANDGYAGYFQNNSGGSENAPALYAQNGDGPVFLAQGANGFCEFDGLGDLFCSGTIEGVTQAGAAKVLVHAVEAPDNWFEDAGSARLEGGSATVALDPTFAQTVNTGVEYHVFLTPNGDCKGLYVSQKTPTSFEVRELGGGSSSIVFDYRIMAKRLGYETKRLEDVTARYQKMQQQQQVLHERMGQPHAARLSSPATLTLAERK